MKSSTLLQSYNKVETKLHIFLSDVEELKFLIMNFHVELLQYMLLSVELDASDQKQQNSLILP